MEFGNTPENDPGGRRRLSAEAMLARDEQVAKLRGEGVSLRQIGARLSMSLASVQLAVRRIQQRGVPVEQPNLAGDVPGAAREERAGAAGGA